MEEKAALLAISPIDGRYFQKTSSLREYFSEYALIRYRILIEVEYFIALAELDPPIIPDVKIASFNALREIYRNFSEDNALKIKEIEKTTNHDVKAVEYFLKDKLEEIGLNSQKEFIHFGLTSQDINNTANPLLLKHYLHTEYLPLLKDLLSTLSSSSKEWENIPMLARTHGQPASPTRLGKEIQVFISRLEGQISYLENLPNFSKFGGATGNLNAHYVAYPEIDWHAFANDFVTKKLGLQRSIPTTQIDHYDFLAAQFDTMKRINTILIDLCRDIWTYISLNYFHQKITKNEVGSSAMPHKVNPIDFENAEGNLGIANALFEHLAAKLPISRMQRDLTDSTVLRNVGVPIAHTHISLQSITKGWKKLELNSEAIHADLESNWAVVAEGIQTVLRRSGFPNPYEALKELTRKNEKITQESLSAFIHSLDIPVIVKEELLNITPFNYTGK